MSSQLAGRFSAYVWRVLGRTLKAVPGAFRFFLFFFPVFTLPWANCVKNADFSIFGVRKRTFACQREYGKEVYDGGQGKLRVLQKTNRNTKSKEDFLK